MIFEGTSSTNKRNAPKQIFQLKITIKDIKPPVWRRLLISSHCTFQTLHEAIQDCFYWVNDHLHEFIVRPKNDPYNGFHIQGKYPDGTDSQNSLFDDIMENQIRLCDVFSEEQKSVAYIYDFGDNWEHEIRLEENFPHDDSLRSFICVGGKRATPPEDCGGAWGYYDLIDILNNPNHPEHEEMKEWAGEDFDPELIRSPMKKMTPKEIKKKYGQK